MDTFEILKGSPVFQMSLSSKELFHSNFLAWIGNDPELREVFRNVMEAIGLNREYVNSWGENFVVLREKQHFDLLVKAPDIISEDKDKSESGEYYLVIENKIKSVPSCNQLDGYSEKLGSNILKNEGFSKILLSIGKFDGEVPDDWKKATYSQVVGGLKMPIPGKISSYKKALIEDYTLMLEKLISIMETIKVSDDECYIADKNSNELLRKLDELRISDLYDKYRASKIALHISKQLGVTCYSGYTNKTPLVEVKIHLSGEVGQPDECEAIIQIQGAQYRRCILGPYRFDELPDKYTGFLYKTKGEFSNALMGEHPGVFRGTKMRGNFCSYGAENKRPFWYQYVVIKPETRICEIIECISQDIKKINKIITLEGTDNAPVTNDWE